MSGSATVYGWVTLAEANTFMATRLGADTYWNSSTSKAAALITAYDDLVTCGDFDFSLDSGEDTPQAFKDAQCEQALFLLRDQDGIEARASLQAQGVQSAGIVQESYAGKASIAICLKARAFLRSYGLASRNSFDVER